MKTTIHVTTSPEYLIEQALNEYDAKHPARDRPMSKGQRYSSAATFIAEWFDSNGYGLRENDAPTMTEHRALVEALAERDLRWADGQLHDGPAEPPAGHVVFDRDREAWQRSEHLHHVDDENRWRQGGNTGAFTWAYLRRHRGPLTPPGGIAPTTTGDTP